MGARAQCAEGGDGGYVLALVLTPHAFAASHPPSVATTLALVLLGLLMKIHAPTSARRTPWILGFTLWQLLCYCQEEIIHVHSSLSRSLHK